MPTANKHSKPLKKGLKHAQEEMTVGDICHPQQKQSSVSVCGCRSTNKYINKKTNLQDIFGKFTLNQESIPCLDGNQLALG